MRLSTARDDFIAYKHAALARQLCRESAGPAGVHCPPDSTETSETGRQKDLCQGRAFD